jgi:hypothetical protein
LIRDAKVVGLQPEQLGRASGAGHLTVRGLQRRPNIFRFELSDRGVGPHAVGVGDYGLGYLGGSGRGREFDV